MSGGGNQSGYVRFRFRDQRKSNRILAPAGLAQLFCIQHAESGSGYGHLLNTDNASGEKRSPVGLLTDGEVWRIYFLQPYDETNLMANEMLWEDGGELYISKKIYTNTEDGERQLLGILSPDSSTD